MAEVDTGMTTMHILETATPGTTGSTTLEGLLREKAIETLAVVFGTVSSNAQIGCVPLGAAIVTRMREPAR